MKLPRWFAKPAATTTVPGDREALLASLLAIAWVVEARDPYTGGHLWRVSRYAALLCERIGASVADCSRVTVGAFLHDLGKVGIPDAILRKPAALSDDEYSVIRTHPDVGARLLAGHPLGSWVIEAVQAHHERPDGRGYPAGLKGDDIPYAALVVGLCDAFDAMASARPYRSAMPVPVSLQRLEEAAGAQFDKTLCRHFLELGREGMLDHIVLHSDEGIPLQHCMICGPTLVVRREQTAGDSVFCRNCGGEYRLQHEAADGHDERAPMVQATGRKGNAGDLAPTADVALIERFIRESAALALR